MYSNFINYLSKYKKVFVLCKGKLSKPIPTNYDIYIGVKQSISILPKKDILVMNDFEGLYGLESCLKDIKYIVCLNKIHHKGYPSKEYAKYLLEYTKLFGFTGEIIRYTATYMNPNPNKSYLLNKKMKNSGDAIYSFFELCPDPSQFEIDIMGMYSSLEDNPDITKIITSAFHDVPNNFKKSYLFWLNRRYRDKKKQNFEFMSGMQKAINPNLRVLSFDLLRKDLKQKFNSLTIRFLD